MDADDLLAVATPKGRSQKKKNSSKTVVLLVFTIMQQLLMTRVSDDLLHAVFPTHQLYLGGRPSIQAPFFLFLIIFLSTDTVFSTTDIVAA